jgi:hypothetical protein
MNINRGAILLFLFCGLAARAASLTYTATPGYGEYHHTLNLSNPTPAYGSLFDLFVVLPIDVSLIDTTSIGAPAGWGDGAGGLLFYGPDVTPNSTFVEWSADFSGVYDIPEGGSLTGFSFTAFQEITSPIQYALNGSNTFETANNVVPEPGSFLLLASVVLLLSVKRKARHW